MSEPGSTAGRADNSGHYDAIVVGAGYAGIYMLHRLRNRMGLDALCLEKGDEVGGTWYWNRYPGALSDTYSHMYRYSFDEELDEEQDLRNWYRPQSEIFEYLRNVVDRYHLRPYISCGNGMSVSRWDEAAGQWEVQTESGQRLTAKYLVTALGVLSAPYVPDIDGLDSFEGQVFHSSRWPADADVRGKRVGVIGTGSTGVQIIGAIAPLVEQLTVFQRTPQYVVPAGNRPYTDEERSQISQDYRQIWDEQRILGGADLPAPTARAMEVTEEERQAAFQQSWDAGNGFRFVRTFSDILTDPAANEAAAAFIRAKIRERVEDPETCRKLTPTGPYTRRPACSDVYYDTFNRDNVSLVSLRDTPITRVTPRGIVTADGKEHELDILVVATGFDAFDGNLRRANIIGRDGRTLNDHWSEDPATFLGTTKAGFPNMFMVSGPQGLVTLNNVVGIQAMVEQIADLIQHAEALAAATVEVTQDAEDHWTQTCRHLGEASWAADVDPGNFFRGGNIPGKRRGVLVYGGGFAKWLECVTNEAQSAYSSFSFQRSQ